jgi:hypothetical protein
MRANMYYRDTALEDIEFPNVAMRKVANVVRTMNMIPGYRAVVDADTNRTFAIVKSGYKLIEHAEAIQQMDTICDTFKEYGTPTKEIWTSNFGGRLKVKYTFKDVDFEIGKLSNGKPDTVHPTMEMLGSYDTSLAHKMLVGGYRLICSNGLTVGKVLASYKRKHTDSLNIEEAAMRLSSAMADYSKATDLWLSYRGRKAFLEEVNAYEAVGFNKTEKESIEASIKDSAKVITWDDDEPKNREVEISAWELLQIYTAEITHKVPDIVRQSKLNDKITNIFLKNTDKELVHG